MDLKKLKNFSFPFYFTCIPAYATIFIIILFPLIYSFYVSLHKWDLTNPPIKFVGLSNYIRILKKPQFHTTFLNTMEFTVLTLFFALLLGLALALLLNRSFFGRGVARGLALLPWAIPPIVIGLLWSWIFHGNYGVLNYVMTRLGIWESYKIMLSSPDNAIYTVAVASIWRFVPFVALFLLAGLQSIPQEVYEAAKVDGASTIQEFFHITLPLLRNSIMIVVLFMSMWLLRTFDIIYAMTQGGPGYSTTMLGWLVYREGFQSYRFGQGATAAYILAIITAALAFLYIKYLAKKVVY